jgi:hypothetical protein
MKKIILVSLLFLVQQGIAQTIVKDHYTPSGGIGAANINKLRVTV